MVAEPGTKKAFRCGNKRREKESESQSRGVQKTGSHQLSQTLPWLASSFCVVTFYTQKGSSSDGPSCLKQIYQLYKLLQYISWLVFRADHFTHPCRISSRFIQDRVVARCLSLLNYDQVESNFLQRAEDTRCYFVLVSWFRVNKIHPKSSLMDPLDFEQSWL